MFTGNESKPKFDSTFTSTPKMQGNSNFNYNQSPYSNMVPSGIAQNLAVLNQPVVQDMALQYGQQVYF